MKQHNEYDEIFKKVAFEFQLDWKMLKAQVKAESGFNAMAVSPVGAKGLAQFMPATWEQIHPKGDIFNPADSIYAQGKYWAWLRRFVDNVARNHGYNPDNDDILICYNWGCGNWKKWTIDNGDYDCLPEETQNYLKRIKEYYDNM